MSARAIEPVPEVAVVGKVVLTVPVCDAPAKLNSFINSGAAELLNGAIPSPITSTAILPGT